MPRRRWEMSRCRRLKRKKKNRRSKLTLLQKSRIDFVFDSFQKHTSAKRLTANKQKKGDEGNRSGLSEGWPNKNSEAKRRKRKSTPKTRTPNARTHKLIHWESSAREERRRKESQIQSSFKIITKPTMRCDMEMIPFWRSPL